MIIRGYRNPRAYLKDWYRQRISRGVGKAGILRGLIWANARGNWIPVTWESLVNIQTLP